MARKNREKLINFICWNAGCSRWVLKASPVACASFRGLGISKLQFLFKNSYKKFSVAFFSISGYQNTGSVSVSISIYPYPDSLEMLDQDPQHCILGLCRTRNLRILRPISLFYHNGMKTCQLKPCASLKWETIWNLPRNAERIHICVDDDGHAIGVHKERESLRQQIRWLRAVRCTNTAKNVFFFYLIVKIGKVWALYRFMTIEDKNEDQYRYTTLNWINSYQISSMWFHIIGNKSELYGSGFC